MIKRVITTFASICLLINIGLVKTVEGNSTEFSETVNVPYYEPVERFGITAPLGFSGYDIESINVRAALNWGADSTFPLPTNVEYIHVLKVGYYLDDYNVRQDLFPSLMESLPSLISANLGEVWIVGNEPDRKYWQDDLFPEEYAQRYYAVASTIRNLDPTAKLAFGTIVQPTPIRIHYLELALNELTSIVGGSANDALALIDIWSIHAFILNEDPSITWGADVPPGYMADWGTPLKITDYSDTYSIIMFMESITRFRDWMNIIGERNKPLWITEYGSLFPQRDPPLYIPPGWPTTPDTINYMVDTFDFLLSATDNTTGYLNDADHLVQRWFWYSLNDHLYSYGGSLFDPDNNYEITLVGEAFRDYTNLLIPKFVFLPIVNR